MNSLSFFTTFFLLLFLAGSGYTQEIEKTRIYETRSNIAAYPCDVLGVLIYNDGRFNVPPYKGRFAFVKKVTDAKGVQKVVVRFLDWSSRDSTTKPLSNISTAARVNRSNYELRKEFNAPIIISKGDSGINPQLSESSFAVQGITNGNKNLVILRYFLITQTDLDSNCVKVFDKSWKASVFTLGVVTMPLKMRLGPNFDFQGNLSIGTTAGVKKRISSYSPNYINILFGLSLATVSLDSFSTSGKISGQPLTNIGVFSPSFGLVFDFGRAQIGAFTGLDFLNKSTQVKYDWIYDRKPWLSIGFGFSIFSVDGKSSATNGSQQTDNSKP